MCGIAGIVGSAAPRDAVERMTERLRHRGPDDSGTWEGDGVRLGHRRLSIIDLSPAGHQPMTVGDHTIVFNGEIYNYRELRDELGGPFQSNSDTETILRLYARDGSRCVERLRGMFAFAIWDAKTRTLFAARDRLGIKPFYYREFGDGLAFASELKALLELGTPEMDRSSIADFLTFKYVPAPGSIYRSVAKLLPAHTLTFDGKIRLERYWTPNAETVRRDPAEAAEELKSLLRDAVRSHLVADVPVGLS